MNNELLCQILDKQATVHDLATEVSNRTYHLMSTIFEHLEGTQTITSNGHHIAQNFARAAELMVIARHVKPSKEEKEKARKELGEMKWR